MRGLHAGPVLLQQGDYYGQTVNLASRIGEYARPGEVPVSQAVVDASDAAAVTFREIGRSRMCKARSRQSSCDVASRRT